MLTERQRGVLEFIQNEQREKGITPSTREIQAHFGFASQTSVMQYIATLERKGFLDRHARKARALITPVQKVRITDIPIYGQIPAGMATLTEQTIDGHVSLDARSVNASKNGRTFALRVRGDSMIDAHILDGDIVILEDRKDVLAARARRVTEGRRGERPRARVLVGHGGETVIRARRPGEVRGQPDDPTVGHQRANPFRRPPSTPGQTSRRRPPWRLRTTLLRGRGKLGRTMFCG